jgi:hypothetical protein
VLSISYSNSTIRRLPGLTPAAWTAQHSIELAKLNGRQSRIVEQRFFGGLSIEENFAGAEPVPNHGQEILGYR